MIGSLAEALEFNVPRNTYLFSEGSHKDFSENAVTWIIIFATDTERRRDTFSSHINKSNCIHLYNE